MKSNQDTNKNDQKNPYPQILSGSNAVDIYPNLDFPLIQKNLTNQSNREFSLSISQIKDQFNSNHLSQNSEQNSNVSVGSRSSKFFNSFNKKKISKQNENENFNNSICLKLLQELNENKRQNLVYRSQIYDHNSQDLKQKQENNKLNKTQMFMRRFNNFDSKEKDEQQKEPKQNISLFKQKTIKFPFNQISSQNEENLDQLTNVINKAKQQENIQIQKQQEPQIKQEQHAHKIFISNSHISDNLQSFTEEPILAGMKPISTLFSSEQVFKKDPYHKNNNQIVKKLKGQQQQNSDGVYDQEQDEQEQNSDGVYDQQDEDQSLLKSQHFQLKKQYRQQKQQFRQNTEKIHQQKVILPEKKEQEQEQWSSRGVKQEEDFDDDQEEEQDQQQQQQQQQQEQQQEEDLEMESRNSQIIGIHMLKSFTTQKIISLKQTTQTYYPSNYFHTGPRCQMFGILRQLVRQRQNLSVNASQNDKRYQTYVNQIQQLENIDASTYQNIYKDILQDLGQKTRLYLKDDVINQIQSVISQYNSSNYFHVGPRRQMFSWVIYLIQLTQKFRKVIQSKTKSSRNSHRMPPSNREVINNQQQQQQQQERQEQNQEQKQEQIQQLDQNQQLEESFQQQDEQNQDDQEQQANDQINNSIHDFLSNYANNDISVLSTQRSLNIRKKQPQVQIKYTTDDIKNYQIGKNLKQVLTPSLIQSLSRTLMQYNSSNYFHVGPRYQLLGFMEQFAKSVENIVKNGGNNLIDSSVGDLVIKKIIKIGEQARKYMNDGKIRQIFNTCRQYGSSNYFHVGPRYSILGDVRKLISICQV